MSICLRLWGTSRERKDTAENDARVTGGLDEVEAGVNAIVCNLLTVNTVLLLQVRVKTRLDVIEYGPPTAIRCQGGRALTENFRTCRRC